MASLHAASSSALDESSTDIRLILVLLTMTLVTGVVDAVSFLATGHVFTANMTGNVALLGFAVAGTPRLSIARSVVSLFAFLFGAVVGGRLGLTFSTRYRRLWVLRVAACEAALLFVAALGGVGLNADSDVSGKRVYVVIVLTALAMGLRTAAMQRLAAVDIRTTVLTSTLAALAGDSSLAGGGNEHLGRRVGSVLAMLAGAALGGLLLRFGVGLPLVLAGILVLGAASAAAWLRPPLATAGNN
jgi:uncharacterized membrane protein YoaK (UPF0700 family)